MTRNLVRNACRNFRQIVRESINKTIPCTRQESRVFSLLQRERGQESGEEGEGGEEGFIKIEKNSSALPKGVYK